MTESAQLESVWEVPNRLRLELLARLSSNPTRPARMSYEDFLEWADEDTLAEWVDGEVVMASPATRIHQDLVSFLDQILRSSQNLSFNVIGGFDGVVLGWPARRGRLSSYLPLVDHGGHADSLP